MSDAPAPTLADVARHAGVSVATASRVLSGSRQVSSEREKRVQEASRALRYRHNAVASALRSQRTETVGFVLPRYSTAFLSALIESASAGLEREGVSLVLRYSAPDARHDRDNIESLLARRVDGIILCPPSEEASRESIALAGSTPVVQVGRFVDPDATDSVGLDESRATALLVAHLATTRATSIVAVGLDPIIPADARRLDALRLAGEHSGIRVRIADPVRATLQGGIDAAELLLAVWTDGAGSAPSTRDWDTLVCANDDVAAGAIAVLRMRGVRVPEDVQVASLLDVSLAEDDVAITTLRHPWSAMGREAVRLLMDARASDRDGVTRRVSLAPQLIVGASTRA
ncbi:LacI family DNA-binding transcriptional regulator [Glaciihabitans sp. dw_435]|uniref:LacI family DNA-binding transcriptional regulator n=1 Tax=Glaciihabitans sp. dw_435 TaxID=2720081 RepID=UPI001BD598DB|nr:LacI family DNA-binding transcriptional regulator [Glaciihabitans sp. dw_435]